MRGGYWAEGAVWDPNWWVIGALVWVVGALLMWAFFYGAFSKDQIVERRLDELKAERLAHEMSGKPIPRVYGTRLDDEIRKLEGQ